MREGEQMEDSEGSKKLNRGGGPGSYGARICVLCGDRGVIRGQKGVCGSCKYDGEYNLERIATSLELIAGKLVGAK